MLEAFMGGEAVVEDDAPPPCAPDDKKPSLSVEELEAKQGNITDMSPGSGRFHGQLNPAAFSRSPKVLHPSLV